ncbi:MAG: cysteine desulfurase NifS [Candidatus Margulisiibacteriota bacterium]|nr:MAG: cysteine desulfurase NifS [Candidatus Margulisiibacteriota bacterium]
MIYLDYNATTPIDTEVARAMAPFISDNFGNPSSTYEYGLTAKAAVDKARISVAQLINAAPDEIIFTSCGSESNNTAIKGITNTLKSEGNHIITSQIEHPSVLNPCKYLEKMGFNVTYVSVDKYGTVKLKELEDSITDKTILVTIMHANNETGTIQPLQEISAICKKHQVLFHTDAAQSVGKIPTEVEKLGVDMLTIAGHKLYAPKGIGALYVRQGVPFEQLIHGAGQESGRRAGTENVIFDVALGKACEIAQNNAQVINKIKDLADYFWEMLNSRFPGKIKLNGHPVNKLPNTVNVSFLGYNGMDIITKLDGVAASTGSACHSGKATVSPVLAAMGVTEREAAGAVRFSLGKYTQKADIDYIIEKLKKIYEIGY